jgi:hypothetical protein
MLVKKNSTKYWECCDTLGKSSDSVGGGFNIIFVSNIEKSFDDPFDFRVELNHYSISFAMTRL